MSVNTTSQLITNSIFNLAAYPEYAPVLRQEIESVLKECGGEWTLESMGNLKKLDSFVKETLRHSGHLVGKHVPRQALIMHSLKMLQQPLFSEKHFDQSHYQMGTSYLPARLPSPLRTQSTSIQTYIQMLRDLMVCASTIFVRQHRRMRKNTNSHPLLRRRCNLEAADTPVQGDGSLVTKSSWYLRPFSTDMISN